MQQITVSNYFIKAVLRNAEAHGLSPKTLLQKSRIPARLWDEVNVRVTPEQFAMLQAATMRAMDDELLGYCHKPLRFGSGSLIAHWLLSARNFGQVLSRYALFYKMLERGFKIETQHDADDCKIILSPWFGESPEPYAYELVLFLLHRFSCWLVEAQIPIKVLHLPYKEPAHVREYRVMYPGTECYFAATQCCLVVPREALRLPVKQQQDALAAFFRAPLLNVLVKDYSQHAWSTKVREQLKVTMQSAPTLVEIAALLEVHPKKLRRMLQDEGISYGELKNQLRRDMAIRRLTRSSVSIGQISSDLGFSEPCTFTRAFRQWTGVAPLAYRKRAKSGVKK